MWMLRKLLLKNASVDTWHTSVLLNVAMLDHSIILIIVLLEMMINYFYKVFKMYNSSFIY